jgi:hypothetical protein
LVKNDQQTRNLGLPLPWCFTGIIQIQGIYTKQKENTANLVPTTNG